MSQLTVQFSALKGQFINYLGYLFPQFCLIVNPFGNNQVLKEKTLHLGGLD